MPLRRVGRPGLVGTVARTAVIAGTAQMTANTVNRHAQQKAAEQQASAEQQDPGYYQPPPVPAQQPPPAAQAPDLVSRLSELAALRQSGALTEEEFQAAKQQLLS